MKKSSLISVFTITIVLTVLSANFVLGADGVAGGFVDKISEILSNAFGGVSSYDYVSNILSPQILFGILIFLVIFAIIEQISIFSSSPTISVIISIIIGILAGGFINPAWIQPLLNQYEALGVTITFLAPLVLIFYALRKLAPNRIYIQKFVWAVYLVILAITYVMNFDKISGGWTKLVYLIAAGGSIIMFVFGAKIYNMLWRDELNEAFEERQGIDDLIAAAKKADAYAALVSIAGTLPTAEKTRLYRKISAMAGPAVGPMP